MPTTVQELFDCVGVMRGGAVRWGTGVPERRPGVYVVSTNEDPTDVSGLSPACQGWVSPPVHSKSAPRRALKDHLFDEFEFPGRAGSRG